MSDEGEDFWCQMVRLTGIEPATQPLKIALYQLSYSHHCLSLMSSKQVKKNTEYAAKQIEKTYLDKKRLSKILFDW